MAPGRKGAERLAAQRRPIGGNVGENGAQGGLIRVKVGDESVAHHDPLPVGESGGVDGSSRTITAAVPGQAP
jgi:hypothetical protein